MMQCQCGHPHGHHMTEQQPEPCLVPDCKCRKMNPYGHVVTRKQYVKEAWHLFKQLGSALRGRR